ncbi:hypothetical protein K2D_35620 [Planctomycetes bacterium K2D]|uniref:Uncharacterized protein n=1 Tax=Botrimarina mediterranea TaxID=2528022 RepID=A0A518KBU8_9BACT|nr:hypothetical protein Spa11_34870 [Botrimarina mediterranea]QDV79942.1 hypothetical protein K2D_35620 [Planctomycetes bacterium K2D]
MFIRTVGVSQWLEAMNRGKRIDDWAPWLIPVSNPISRHALASGSYTRYTIK